jgi:hypothetical protein
LHTICNREFASIFTQVASPGTTQLGEIGPIAYSKPDAGFTPAIRIEGTGTLHDGDIVGILVGLVDGTLVGPDDGDVVVLVVGLLDGSPVGCKDGDIDAVPVGPVDGTPVGCEDGDIVCVPVRPEGGDVVGDPVGDDDGA